MRCTRSTVQFDQGEEDNDMEYEPSDDDDSDTEDGKSLFTVFLRYCEASITGFT
jgi:hypothetical protein